MQGSSQVVVRSTAYLVVEDKLQQYGTPSKMNVYKGILPWDADSYKVVVFNISFLINF